MPKYNRKFEEIDGEVFETWTNRSGTIQSGQPISSSWDDDGDIGCQACGNPAYPDCKSSCNLFDD